VARESRLTPLAASLVEAAAPAPDAAAFAVAVSGGPDSAVAAFVTASVADGRPVKAIHVDHGQPASASLRVAAAAVARHLELPIETVGIDVPPGAGWEERARIARLAALEVAAVDALLVTGHHADDQAETVLANLLRGAGAHGLAGMARRRDRWWRPLLTSSRAEIREVADELGLPYLDDPANEDPAYGRNQLRHRVLPSLDEVRPGVVERLVRTAAHLEADEAALEGMAGDVPIKRDRDAWLVPMSMLRTLAAPVATRVIRRAIRLARPPYPGTSAEIERVTRVAAGLAPATELGGGLVAADEGAYLALYRDETPEPPDPVELAIPGSVEWNGWRLAASGAATWRTILGRSRALVDLGAAQVSEVRAARRTDRIAITGGSKRVFDALAEQGVPRRLRAGWPVVAVDGNIAWVAGVRVAAWCRPTPGGEPITLLALDPIVEEP
jgi:tRNA(Ile)-lysidine synthase